MRWVDSFKHVGGVMTANNEEYLDVVNKLHTTLEGADLDDVVPATAMVLGLAGVMAGADKKLLISFVVDTIDRVYRDADKLVRKEIK
jgi:hypothetical protein